MNQMKIDKNRVKRCLFSLGGLGIFLILWVLISLITDPFIVPLPWSILTELFQLLTQSHTWVQLAFTLMRVITGFTIAILIGTVGGMISGRVEWVEALMRTWILFLQGIPPILWAIPLILIFGTGGLSPVLVITLICVPLVFLNIFEGVKSVPQELEEMLKVYAPGLYPKLREIILPHLSPFFSASLKLGLTLGIKASVVGEYFGANNGIGFQIQAAYQSMQIKKLFAWTLFLVIIIIVTSRISITGKRKKSSVYKGIHVEVKDKPASGKFEDSREFQKIFPEELKNILKPTNKPLFLDKISFSYPGQKELLTGIDLKVEPGEVAVITGESGIGKTTLLKIIARFLIPLSGYVEAPEKIGFVFQDDRLIPWCSVLRNVALPIRYQGNSWKFSFTQAQKLLTLMGLGGEYKKLPNELSGGMRKRAALARCFARKPELVILDEPYSGLHKEARVRLWEILFRVIKPSLIPAVVVTHFPEELTGRPECIFYELRGKPAQLYTRK